MRILSDIDLSAEVTRSFPVVHRKLTHVWTWPCVFSAGARDRRTIKVWVKRGGWVSRVLGRYAKFGGVRKIARGDVVQFLRRAVAPEEGIAVGWRPKRAITARCPRGYAAPNS